MPSGINTQNLFTNTQFQQFVEFAKISKDGDIAKMSLSPGGKEHSIVGTKESFIGKLFRSDATKNANNYTRTIFKESIAKMFGGESNIPDSVKDAMKMADYDKGRPLTARRIIAVKTAIDQVAEKMKTCVEESKANFNYTTDGREKCDEMIEKAFIACNGNTDAMDIVKTHIGEITVNSASSLRTEEGMQKKVEGLLDNLNELKELSKQNPAIYTAGKHMLRESGTALPKGMITKLVQACNEAPINDLRKLSGSSSGMSIHDVTVQMYKTIKHAMSFSGADKQETPEKMAARDFIASTILSRCSKSALKNIRSALNTEVASTLNEYYSQTEAGRNDCADDKSWALKAAVKDIGCICYNFLEILDINVNRNLDRLEPKISHNSRIPKFEGTLDLDDIGGQDILDKTIGLAKELNDGLAQDLIDETVEGSGKGADAVKTALRKKIGESNNPGFEVRTRLGVNANAMMNINICGEMNKIALGQDSQFKKDVYRSGPIHLKNGDIEIKLDKNFETARNQLAQFVTGDAKSTYDKLEPEGKNKVHLMMAMISQETEKAAEMGSAIALDPREAEQAVSVSGKYESNRTYQITKLADGGITFHYTMEKAISDITTDDLDDYVDLGAGSSFNYEMDYTLHGDEFNRLAELDYTKYNDDATKASLSKKIEMPDGSKKFPENYLMNVVDSIQDDFKINSSCRMNLTMKLMPTEDELLLSANDSRLSIIN